MNIDQVRARFPIGSEVVVPSIDPYLLSNEWPGITESMHQFFSNSVLRVVDYVVLSKDRIGLVLDTSRNGTTFNFTFNVEWVLSRNSLKVQVEQLPYVRRGQNGGWTRGFAQKVNASLAHKRSIKNIRDNVSQETPNQEPLEEIGIFDEPTVEMPDRESEEVTSHEPTIAQALGGAVAVAFGTALVKHMAMTKKNRENNIAAKTKTVEEAKVAEEIQVPVER